MACPNAVANKLKTGGDMGGNQHQAWVAEKPKPITLAEAGIDKKPCRQGAQTGVENSPVFSSVSFACAALLRPVTLKNRMAKERNSPGEDPIHLKPGEPTT